MKSCFITIILIALFLIPSCDTPSQNQKNQKKEDELQLKEIELNAKEEILNQREQDLIKRELKINNSLKTDTVPVQNAMLIGRWQSMMTCTETTCVGSAIGDTKSEEWSISYQADSVIAKAIAGENLLRIYKGSFTDNSLELSEDRPATKTQPASKTSVRLRFVDSLNLQGQREIVRDNGCKIIFSIQLEKQN